MKGGKAKLNVKVYLRPVPMIERIDIYKSPVKLKEAFVISLGSFDYAENIIVRVQDSNGNTGFGECSPFPSIHGETMHSAFIIGSYLAKIILGKNADNHAENTAAMDKAIYANTSIKSAFDIALYDIAAQDKELPLYKYLGAKQNKVLYTDYTVSIGDAAKMARDADKIKQQGFPFIKVKLGGEAEEDMERIKQIRYTVGEEIPIRVDANQGWDFVTAVTVLKRIEPYKIQHCEEPLPRWNYRRLSELRKLVNIPIMADESVCDHHDAEKLIELGACDYFNIKLGKSSGLFKAIKILTLAERASIKMQVGGFLESRLGFTAAAHFAQCSDEIIYCDFDTPLMFEEDPISGGIVYGAKGKIELPDSTGLGASVSESYLSKLESASFKI